MGTGGYLTPGKVPRKGGGLKNLQEYLGMLQSCQGTRDWYF